MHNSNALQPIDPVAHAQLLAERDQLRADVDRLKAAHIRLTSDLSRLRATYEAAITELALLKRRLFVAKAERFDTTQLELEFAKKSEALEALRNQLPEDEALDIRRPAGPAVPPTRPKRKPSGRRQVDLLNIPEERLPIPDPLFEALVAEGKARVSDTELSYMLAWRRGGMYRLVMERLRYETTDKHGVVERDVAPVPPALLNRSLAAPSLLAHVITDKYCDGLPLHRIEERFAREGVPVDRGTLSRWLQGVGLKLASVVEAMKRDAFSRAFCIATDATGICIQPTVVPKGPRRPCRKGTFFTLVADRDHVLFEYLERETSDAVRKLLEGFQGYLQADAKGVYDAIFRERAAEKAPLLGGAEVGCWAHARRKFWEAAVCKDALGREGLVYIRRLFKMEETWRHKPPIDRARLRKEQLKPELDAFFEWATLEYERLKDVRGLARSAFGYVVRQRVPLSAFLADGRLIMDNNRAERALRSMRVGQKAWLFCGSDDHAQTTAVLFSLAASARLHDLDPEAYLRDLIRIRPHWPEERLIELAPLNWTTTLARLNPEQVAAEFGALDVPAPLVLAA